MEDLEQLAEDLTDSIRKIDQKAEHENWKPGIAPFEEERQIELIVDELDDGYSIEIGKRYLDTGKEMDLYWKEKDIGFEVKLLRFWQDNGNLDHNWYGKIFSPFRNSFVNDANKLYGSEFEGEKALIGIHYDKQPGELEWKEEKMELEKIARKYEKDVKFWHGISLRRKAVERFEGLRHPVFSRGAVLIWKLEKKGPLSNIKQKLDKLRGLN